MKRSPGPKPDDPTNELDDDTSGRAELVGADLFDRALRDEQSVHVLTGEDDSDAIRRAVRCLARQHGTPIRTGIIEDDVLAVSRLDAAVWNQPATVMPKKLRPTSIPPNASSCPARPPSTHALGPLA